MVFRDSFNTLDQCDWILIESLVYRNQISLFEKLLVGIGNGESFCFVQIATLYFNVDKSCFNKNFN